ncbi:MAG: hypothetical protein FWD69_04090 [Polyangiaceae bacterium]|nr:hypothetical protein [Polyangiaceae bacterium]
MKLPGVPYEPRYTSDELTVGIVVGIALHLLAIGPFLVKAAFPSANEVEEKPLVARPIVQASLLKLGKPIDPRKLPDRLVPRARTAPKHEIVASSEEPKEPALKKDAGAPPPPNTQESDIEHLIAKSDPFAEDAGRARAEEGNPGGVDGGTETDPNKVRAGDMYATQLSQFFGQRLTVPTIIPVNEARKLCVLLQVTLNRNMIIWYIRQNPVISSGNDLFDDAARSMLQKLLDDRTPLPEPPKELAELYRGRVVQLVIQGDPHGDSSRCMPK